MTQLTARWIRGIAIVLNVLVYVRLLLGWLLFYSRAMVNPPVGEIVWLGLSLAAPLLAIVAIISVVEVPDSRKVSASPSA